MANSKKSTRPAADDDVTGFGEAPQAAFEGAPITGPAADWLASVAGLEDEIVPPSKPARAPKTAKPAKSARGTSMGASTDPKTRAAGGLNPVAGMALSLEEAEALTSTGGVTATVKALEELIQGGRDLFRDGSTWVPHRPVRPGEIRRRHPLPLGLGFPARRRSADRDCRSPRRDRAG